MSHHIPSVCNRGDAWNGRAAELEAGSGVQLLGGQLWDKVALSGGRPFPVECLGLGASVLCPRKWLSEPECSQPPNLASQVTSTCPFLSRSIGGPISLSPA